MPLKRKETNISNKHNRLKNPNWREADQLAIYKHGRGVELGSTKKQLQLVVRAGLEPATSGFQVRRLNHSATLPPMVGFKTDLKRILNGFKTVVELTSIISLTILHCFHKVQVRQAAILIFPELLASL